MDCSNESRLQRCWSFGSRNLGRCLRLRLNSAPLALNTPRTSSVYCTVTSRADWNFGEEFARSICRQPNAAVRCRIVRHITGVHSKIETAQAHEIRHLDVVNGGTMVAFLVGDHKLAPLRGVARPTGRASRLIYRFAVPERERPFASPEKFRSAIYPAPARRREEFARNASARSPRQHPMPTFCSGSLGASGLLRRRSERFK